MKHVRTIAIFSIASTFLSVSGASASLLPGGIGEEWQKWVLERLNNPLEQVQAQIQRGDELLNTILKEGLGGVWDEIPSASGSQIPDPYQVRSTTQTIPSGVLATNPIIQRRDAANLYDQELGRAISAPVLGDTGRKWLEQEAKQTGEIVQTNQKGLQVTQKLAQEAQSLTSTQDVVKNNSKGIASLAGILTNQSQLTADQQVALLKLQKLQGTAVQLAANASEGIDESNRRDRVTRQIELSSATRTELYIPGLYTTTNERR